MTNVLVNLDRDLEHSWRKFHSYTAEMIVVKERGRKLFPRIEYSIKGLLPDEYYAIVLTFKRVDDFRYKYSCGEWQTNGKGEAHLPEQPEIHQEGVVNGRTLMQKKISFDYLRVTNNLQNRGMIVLQSMHKYQAVLEIFQVFNRSSPITDYYQLKSSALKVAEYSPEHIRFIAVTAYFNANVRELKIEMNKYAKGHKTDKYSPKAMKSCDSPLPSSTYTTPNTSPEVPNLHLDLMRSIPYQMPNPQIPNPLMWNEMYPFNMLPYQPTPVDNVYNPYSFLPFPQQ